MGWIDDLVVKLSGGAFSIAGLLNVSAGSIVTEKDKFITSQGITKVIQITEMPFRYADDLIVKISKMVAKENNNIMVKSYIEAERCVIPTGHVTFVNKANKAVQKYAELDQLFRSLDPINQKAGVFRHNGVRQQSFTKADVEKAKSISDSFTEVRNHIKQDGGVYFLAKIFIHLVFPTNDLMLAHYVTIANFIESEVARVERVNKKVGTYLMNMSPAATNIQGISSSTVLASQESLTNLIPYRSEGLLSTKGVLMGTNVLSSTPFYIDVFSCPDGSTVLVVADAGSGKTTFCYHYAAQKMGAGVTVVYFDIKGKAVSKVFSEITDDYTTLAFSGKDAQFINTLLLDPNNPDYTMEDAIKVTADWFSIMVALQPNEGNSQDLTNLLKAAIRGYYTSVGVSPTNIDSYVNSQGMELGRVIEFLGQNRNESTSKIDVNLYEIAAKRILALLQEYNMMRNDNAIDIASLFDYGGIIFDFNKNKDVTLSLIDQVRLYSAIFFVKQLTNYNKRNGNFTELFADEGNQYLDMPGLSEFISDLTARARSENMSVVFITNDLSVVSKDSMSGFRSNIAIYVVGKAQESDIELLSKLTSSKLLIEDVNEIVKQPGKYRHCFAVSSNLGGHKLNTIVRADIPKEIADAFASRTVRNDAI